MSQLSYYTNKIFTNGTEVGYLSPKFNIEEPIGLKQSIQLITQKLINNFSDKANLETPGFINNIIEIYQDTINTHSLLESRGIIQLYTIYYLLHLISAYWTGIQDIRQDLTTNKNGILNIMISHQKILKNKKNTIDTKDVNSLMTTIKDAYNVMDIVLNPHKSKDIKIPTGIKYFLFRRPVNIDWKYYDTILYYGLLLITTIFNYVYLLKTTPKLDKKNETKLKKYIYNKTNKHPKLDIKPISQLFLLYAYINQHSSRQPYAGKISMKNSINKLNNTNNTNIKNNSKETIDEELINEVNNSLNGISSQTNYGSQTIGSYSILNAIFQLMYYHPFPYDAKLLKKFQKNPAVVANGNHPINVVNQTHQNNLKKEMGNKKHTSIMTADDEENLEILQDIGDTFFGVAKTANKFKHISKPPKCKIDKHGKKKCGLNPNIKTTLSLLSGRKSRFSDQAEDAFSMHEGKLRPYGTKRNHSNSNNSKNNHYSKRRYNNSSSITPKTVEGLMKIIQ